METGGGQHSFLIEFQIYLETWKNLEGAGESRWRRLPAGDEELQSDGDVNFKVQSLDLKRRAEASRRFDFRQAGDHRAAFVHGGVA